MSHSDGRDERFYQDVMGPYNQKYDERLYLGATTRNSQKKYEKYFFFSSFLNVVVVFFFALVNKTDSISLQKFIFLLHTKKL